MPVQKRKQKHTSIFHAVVYTFLVFGIIFTQVSWAFAAEAPVPPAASNANAPKATTAPGAVEKSITDYLCTPDGEGKGTNALIFNCVNKLYRFSIAFGVSVAILFIIFAGYLYMSGSEKGVTEAKSIIENTAAGLLILFVSFLLLRQINPELTRFKSIQLPQIAPAGNTVDPSYVQSDDPSSEPPGGSHHGGDSADLTETSCGKNINNCVLLKTIGVACNKGDSNCYVQKALATKLQQLNSVTNGAGITFVVTEAWRNTGSHKDGCHGTGACVDIAVNSANEANWVKLCNTIKQTSGMGFLNEIIHSPNSSPILQACGTLRTGGSGDHLHLFISG